MHASSKIVLLFALAAITNAAQAFTLDSPQIKPGGDIAREQVYTQCGGGNVSPQLAWHDPPGDTKSFAVSVFDSDASGGFWHWIAFDIHVGAHGLNAGAGTLHNGNAPGDTIQIANGFGDRGYAGPCPPPGKPHRYVFTVYALDVPTLGLSIDADASKAIAAIKRHVLGTATLTAQYGR